MCFRTGALQISHWKVVIIIVCFAFAAITHYGVKGPFCSSSRGKDRITPLAHAHTALGGRVLGAGPDYDA